jgi:hypothetical protein
VTVVGIILCAGLIYPGVLTRETRKAASPGFRNRDLLTFSSLSAPGRDRTTPAQYPRESAANRFLRAHGISRKAPKSHRDRLTDRGRLLAAALFVLRQSTLAILIGACAVCSRWLRTGRVIRSVGYDVLVHQWRDTRQILIQDGLAGPGPQLCDDFYDGHRVPNPHRIRQEALATGLLGAFKHLPFLHGEDVAHYKKNVELLS